MPVGVDRRERGGGRGAIADRELELGERDRAGVVIDRGDPLRDRARLGDPAEPAIEPRDHGERVGVAAIVVEQRQQIDRRGAVVGLAQQPEQLLGDVERLAAAIERAAGLGDRLIEVALAAQRAREVEPGVDVVRIALEHRAQLAGRRRQLAAHRQPDPEPVVAVDRRRDVRDQDAQRGLGGGGGLQLGEPEVGALVVGLQLDRAEVRAARPGGVAGREQVAGHQPDLRMIRPSLAGRRQRRERGGAALGLHLHARELDRDHRLIGGSGGGLAERVGGRGPVLLVAGQLAVEVARVQLAGQRRRRPGRRRVGAAREPGERRARPAASSWNEPIANEPIAWRKTSSETVATRDARDDCAGDRGASGRRLTAGCCRACAAGWSAACWHSVRSERMIVQRVSRGRMISSM